MRLSNIGCTCVLLVILAGCAQPPPVLRVGAKASTSQQVVGEIIAQVAEKKLGRPVTRQFTLSGTQMAHEALISGQIDLYAEDAIGATTEVLRQEPGSDAEATFNLCRSQYAANFQADWLDPLGLETTIVIAGRQGLAAEIGGATLSAAAASQKPFRIAVNREFGSRKTGYTALQQAYNLRFRDAPRMGATAAELLQWLDQKQVDLVAVDSSNSRLEGDTYEMLEDDKRVFQPSRHAIVIRQDARKNFAGLDAALGQLSGKLSLKTIRQLARGVDGQNRRPAEVASEFLRSLGQ